MGDRAAADTPEIVPTVAKRVMRHSHGVLIQDWNHGAMTAALPGSLSLVIPAHNEAENIGPLVDRCLRVLPGLSHDWEIVLVDDGSSDDTAEVARKAMGDEAGRLSMVRHERKSGYGVTVADGLRAARGRYVGFMDGDGQFDPADLEKLAAQFTDADLVTGRRERRADPRYRLLIAGVFNILIRLLYRVRFRDVDCGMKLMRREVLDAAAPIQARSALLNTELYFKAQRNGFRVRQVPVPHYPRVAGVRSGARLIPILRAIRDLVWLRLKLAQSWHARGVPEAASGS
jgi:glycosyltransferase involved in cell wall biosynthesis